jgi:hypothetical protein
LEAAECWCGALELPAQLLLLLLLLLGWEYAALAVFEPHIESYTAVVEASLALDSARVAVLHYYCWCCGRAGLLLLLLALWRCQGL